MPGGVKELLQRLESIAAYEGPWTVLEKEAALLRTRLEELRARENRLDDLLIVALVGGSGVGKSTLLNALAGDELAKTSEYRPCTSSPTVYHPPGVELDFGADWKRVAGSALEHLVIIDTPDSDTIVHAHRQIVIEVLRQCDLILVCADSEKYLDEATWSLLRPLRHERTFVCIETKAAPHETVKDHWLGRLKEQGLEAAAYFRVNSRRTFDRKIAGRPAGEEEFDFVALEQFLYRELTRDRIQRIKRSNAAGLLTKTIVTLEERIASQEKRMERLAVQVNEADAALGKAAYDVVARRLFAEPHLWTYALGREVSLRAKGFTGTVFRMVEALRSLPARVASMASFWPGRGAGHQAASLLSENGVVDSELRLTSNALQQAYADQRSELGLRFAKAGFSLNHQSADGYDDFMSGLNARISDVLSGPARERIVARARLITSWPVTILLDLPPLAFLLVTGWKVVDAYFFLDLVFGVGFFLHAGAVFAIILGVELFLLSLAIHVAAWSARQSALGDLRIGLIGNRVAFARERQTLQHADAVIQEVRALRQSLAEV